MSQHVHENEDWKQNTWWMPVDADAKRVNWNKCDIENWDYQWFLDPTRRAPRWLDLTPAYRQWWISSMLPSNEYYLAWINYEEGTYGRKIRQLTGWINEWEKLSQRSKMGFFDPVIRTERARSLQPGAKLSMITPNPFKISAYAIDTAVLPGREVQLHGNPQAVTQVHLGTELIYEKHSSEWPDQRCPPGTRFRVTKMDTIAQRAVYDYLLENEKRTITYWIPGRRLLFYINNDILRFSQSDKLDALRMGPRHHKKFGRSGI
jgi:hypothetical protein